LGSFRLASLTEPSLIEPEPAREPRAFFPALVATAHNNTHVNYPPKRSQDFLLVVSTLHIIFFMNHGYHRQQIRDPPSLASPLLRFRRAGGEEKRRAYLFVAREGHDEDLGIWSRHRLYTARYIGREHTSRERSPTGAAPNQETPAPGVSPKRARECECLPSLVPAEATQYHHQLRSICRLLPRYDLSCPIYQTWTPHR
jgi:hypothetical protein